MTEQVIFGLHAIKALLNNPHRQTKVLFINQDRHDKRIQDLIQLAKLKKVAIEALSSEKLQAYCKDYGKQTALALAEKLPDFTEADLPDLLKKSKNPPLLLILDGLTDPQNLGACLRTAEATSVDFLLCPKDNSASISPVVSKIASGATETLPLIRVTNLVRAMETLKQAGVWLYGAAGEANHNLYQCDFSHPTALILGAEGSGLRRLTKEHCDFLFSIPMQGQVESLNVSVATGVALYEVLRQRSFN